MDDMSSKSAAPRRRRPSGPPNPEALPARIPINSILPDPSQPRRTFDPEELQALADSMNSEDIGLIQPILVRESIDNPGLYFICAGERRWRAAQLNGWRVIDAIIRTPPTDYALRIVQIVENSHRVNLPVLDEAHAVGATVQMGQAMGKQIAEIAADIAYPVRKMHDLAELARASDTVKQLAVDGRTKDPELLVVLERIRQASEPLFTELTGPRLVGLKDARVVYRALRSGDDVEAVLDTLLNRTPSKPKTPVVTPPGREARPAPGRANATPAAAPAENPSSAEAAPGEPTSGDAAAIHPAFPPARPETSSAGACTDPGSPSSAPAPKQQTGASAAPVASHPPVAPATWRVAVDGQEWELVVGHPDCGGTAAVLRGQDGALRTIDLSAVEVRLVAVPCA